MWRTTATGKRIKNMSAKLFGDAIAHEYCSKMPGRPLRGRWGAIESNELMLTEGFEYIARSFSALFPAHAAEKKRAALRVGTDEAEEYAALDKQYKSTATEMLNNTCFHATVWISHVAKRPLTSFLHWGQKDGRIMNKKIAAARADGHPYLGPTCLANLVDFPQKMYNVSSRPCCNRTHYTILGFGGQPFLCYPHLSMCMI